MTSKLTRTPQAWRGDHSGPSPARGGEAERGEGSGGERTLCSAEAAAVAESGAAPSGHSSAPPGKNVFRHQTKPVVCSAPSLRGAGFALVRRSCSHVKTGVGLCPPSKSTRAVLIGGRLIIKGTSIIAVRSVFPIDLGRSYHCPGPRTIQNLPQVLQVCDNHRDVKRPSVVH